MSCQGKTFQQQRRGAPHQTTSVFIFDLWVGEEEFFLDAYKQLIVRVLFSKERKTTILLSIRANSTEKHFPLFFGRARYIALSPPSFSPSPPVISTPYSGMRLALI
jgi:hypothetical protein